MWESKYFNVGKVVCTATINNLMSENKQFAREILSAMERYCNKDWGDLDAEDKQINDDALNYPEDLYLLAAYKTCKGKIYIITNRISEMAGDNATTICFSDER
mgnify:CR=1 FL=1